MRVGMGWVGRRSGSERSVWHPKVPVSSPAIPPTHEASRRSLPFGGLQGARLLMALRTPQMPGLSELAGAEAMEAAAGGMRFGPTSFGLRPFIAAAFAAAIIFANAGVVCGACTWGPCAEKYR